MREREREKVGEGAIRKIRKNSTQGETAAKSKLAEQKDNQRREEQGKIDERNIKTRNTLSVLQEEERDPIAEDDSPPRVKADKNEKKITLGKERGKARKSLNEMKKKGETTPKPGIIKITPMKELKQRRKKQQNKNNKKNTDAGITQEKIPV